MGTPPLRYCSSAPKVTVLLLFLCTLVASLGSLLVPAASAAPLGIWLTEAEIDALPNSGAAWQAVLNRADGTWGDNGTVTLFSGSHDDDMDVYAGALAWVRTGTTSYRTKVRDAIEDIIGTQNNTDFGCCGEALGIARNTVGFVIAADLIDLPALDATLNTQFRAMLTNIRDRTPNGLVAIHEKRPNNFGTHAGAARIAVDLYLGATTDLARAILVFQGWLGDRTKYTGFSYGELSWQCDPGAPVGINPQGCTKQGHNIDGVLPEDQRRGGGFAWPAPKVNYVWGALDGTVVTTELLRRAGYPSIEWSNEAVKRAYTWLHTVNNFPAAGDNQWNPHVANFLFSTSFPAPIPAEAGKNMGFTDWTHAGRTADEPAPPPTPDTTAPTVSLTAPTNNSTVDGDAVSVTATASDDVAVTTVTFWAGTIQIGSDASSPYSMTWDSTQVANGVYDMTARAVDAAGNSTTSSIHAVTVDNEVTPPPAPEFESHTPVTGLSSASTTVSTSSNVTAVEGDLYLAAINANKAKTVTGVTGMGLTWTQVASQCGARGETMMAVWKAQGTPTANGVVTATFNSQAFTAAIAVTRYSGVDDTAPVGANAKANTLGTNGACTGGTDSTSPSVSVTTTEADSWVIGHVSLRVATFTAGSGYTETVEIHNTGGGTAGLAVEEKQAGAAGAVTANGTITSSTDWAIVAVEVIPATSGPPADTTAPVISSVAASSITDTSATVSWDTDEAATSTVDYGTTPSYGSQVQALALVTEHSLNLTGLTPDTLYHFRVRSTDAVGNEASSSGMTFRTLDLVAPSAVQDLTAGSITQDSALLTWTAPGDNATTGTATVYDVRYSTSLITAANFEAAQAVTGIEAPQAAGETEDVLLSGLTPYTTYYVAMRSEDDAGLTSDVSNVAVFITGFAPVGVDDTAPVMTNIVHTYDAATGMIRVCWLTNEPADSVIWFAPVTESLDTQIGEDILVTSHSLTLAAIQAGTQYAYQVRSTDAAGNLALSPVFTLHAEPGAFICCE